VELINLWRSLGLGIRCPRLDGYYESFGKRWGTNSPFQDKNISVIYISKDFRTAKNNIWLHFAVFAYQRFFM
jgi:hypothetical protein